jgi:hypothetical protein
VLPLPPDSLYQNDAEAIPENAAGMVRAEEQLRDQGDLPTADSL